MVDNDAIARFAEETERTKLSLCRIPDMRFLMRMRDACEIL